MEYHVNFSWRFRYRWLYTLAAASLNDYATELTTPKFMDTSMDIDGDGINDAVPYIIPEYLGNLDGTTKEFYQN